MKFLSNAVSATQCTAQAQTSSTRRNAMVKLQRVLVPFAVVFTLVLVTPAVWATEYVDPSFGLSATQVRGMHGCDEEFLVVGVHVANNLLLCTNEYTSTQGAKSRFIDTSTQITVGGVRMHGCPSGSAVKGLHVGKNLLICESASINDGDIIADPGTQRVGMHACPVGRLLKGIHVDQNVFACVRTVATAETAAAGWPTLAFALMLTLGGYRVWRMRRGLSNKTIT
jgi:hypothetical protein